MKIHFEIGELVLQGFDYHDHRKIGLAIEEKLSMLVKENGLLNINRKKYNLLQIDSIPINLSLKNMDPKSVGSEVALSIYRGLPHPLAILSNWSSAQSRLYEAGKLRNRS